jgi:hypothetical protein
VSTTEPRSGYEGVRKALQDKGYLETPLERFFLGGASPFGATPRGVLIGALLTGILGGALLGALLALAVVVEGRGGVPLWPDAVLYALLFAPLVGGVVAVAEALAGLIIRRLARARPGLSPRRAALAAGLIVASALALYLGVWWARSGAALTPEGLLSLAALALGAGLTGRVVSAAALAQAMVATGRGPGSKARALRSIVLLSLAVAGLGALATATLGAREAPAGEPVALRADAPERAVLVAWDGIERSLWDGLVREGDVARLATRLDDAHTWNVTTRPGLDPAARWTSVATGCWPETHGVAGAGLASLRGAKAPLPTRGLASAPLEVVMRLWPIEARAVRSGVRSIPAIWEVAADAHPVAVVGWWGTWPAAPPGEAGGYVVSDGALAALRAEHGLEEAIHPASWSARADAWLERAREAAFEWRDVPEEVARKAHEALITDLFHVEALSEALRDPGVEVGVIYLPGLDILRTAAGRSGVDLLRTLDRVREHAGAVDRALGRVLAAALPPERGQLALVGLPGRAGGVGGLLAVGGAGRDRLEAGLPTLDEKDVGPAWLGATGHTVDARMCVGPAERLAAELGVVADVRRTRVRPAAPSEDTQNLEVDVLERLRSLGYLD